MDNFLSGDLIDENQSQVPVGYEVIKKYPLRPPFSYANILYNKENMLFETICSQVHYWIQNCVISRFLQP